MKKNMGILSLIFFYNLSVYSAQVYELEALPQSKIKIELNSVKITFKASATQKFKLSFVNNDVNKNAIIVSREGDLYRVRSSSFQADTDLYQLELSGAPMEVELVTKKSEINAFSWGKKIQYKCIDCKTNIQNVAGDISAYQLFGDFKADSVSGRMDLDFFAVSTLLQKNSGEVEVRKFKSDLTINDLTSNVQVQEGFGTTKINSATRAGVLNQKGNVSVQGVKEKLEVVNAEGQVNVAMGDQKETLIKNAKGKIAFSDYAGKGLSLDIKMDDGDVYIPNELKVYKLGNQKIARGFLKGAQKGQGVRVRSIEGTVQFR